jgi:hypothetical protein
MCAVKRPTLCDRSHPTIAWVTSEHDNPIQPPLRTVRRLPPRVHGIPFAQHVEGRWFAAGVLVQSRVGRNLDHCWRRCHRQRFQQQPLRRY